MLVHVILLVKKGPGTQQTTGEGMEGMEGNPTKPAWKKYTERVLL